ncbi:MAG: DUF6264 family protein [Pseudolysinimonas sp.]
MSEPSQPTPPPVPQYGEYAPAGYVPPQPNPSQPSAPASPVAYPMHPAPAGRRRKTWDLVLTIVLLVLGLFGVLIALAYAALFSDPALIDQGLQQQGMGGFNGTIGAQPTVIVVSHVLLYLGAVGGSIPLLLSKRVAFWVPLGAGVVAAIIFWIALTSILASDPALLAQYS